MKKKYILLLLLLSSVVYGVTLFPMSADMVSKKSRKVLFTVSNPTKEPVAVEFSILRLLNTDNNKEKRVKTSNVTYYPSQFVLAPGKSRNIRVRYMKNSLPKSEEVYRVIASELDIDVSDRKANTLKKRIKANIKFRFTYEGLLFVSDGKAYPKLEISSFEQREGVVDIVVQNSGTKSEILSSDNYNIIATVNSKEYLLTKEDLQEAEFRRILPRKSNRYTLKYIKNLPHGMITNMRLELKN